MDTATHFAFGFGLAGLSQMDPNVTVDAWTTLAVMIGTVAGSQAPDADTVLRLRGNEVYVRHHRGISHSIPFWFLWTGLISALLWLLFPGVSFLTLAMWVFIAVFIHVFSDMFNTYGTQALRPITSRWVAWHIIHIFDPFLFGSHIIAILLWITGLAEATVIFPTLYALIALYYVWRSVARHLTMKELPRQDADYAEGDRYTAIPTVNWSVWNIVKQSPGDRFKTGMFRNGRLIWNDEYESHCSPEIELSKDHPSVAAFLSFSSHPCPLMEKRGSITIVRWIDTRYQHRKQYPFLAVVMYNANMEASFSYVGWISDEKLEQKLNAAPSDSILFSSR